jgi:hypothetical protein
MANALNLVTDPNALLVLRLTAHGRDHLPFFPLEKIAEKKKNIQLAAQTRASLI